MIRIIKYSTHCCSLNEIFLGDFTNQTREPLPTGYLTVTDILGLLQEKTGVQPCEVSVMNDRDVLVEFEQGAPVVDISRQLVGPGM